MAYEFIKTENRDGVLVLTMHDPPTRNALGPEMAAEVRAELDRFEDDPECRVLLVTGTDPSFCSGANVRNFNRQIQEDEDAGAEPEPLPWGKMESRFAIRDNRVEIAGGAPLVPLRIHKLQKPSIAAVNGHAMGVGMGVALACDIRIAAEGAIFSEAFSRMGLIPGDGSCWQLPRLIGMSNTLLLQYTGDRIDGNEAFRLGIASQVVAQRPSDGVGHGSGHPLGQGPDPVPRIDQVPGAPQHGPGLRGEPGPGARGPGPGTQDRGPQGGGAGLPGKAAGRLQGPLEDLAWIFQSGRWLGSIRRDG